MSNLARQAHPDFALTVLSGSDKGSTYKLVRNRVTIGRASDNDICIKDDSKISRNHAELIVTPLGVEINDISGHNKTLVNGEEVKRVFLTAGAIIQLGETKFQYKILSEQNLAPSSRKSKSRDFDISRPQFKNKNTNFYILVAAILLLGFWLFSGSNDKENSDLKPILDTEKTISANQKIVEMTESENQKLGLNTPQYAEAQPNFIKGFRDYRKGQYERAIESFQACLSLFPQHQQCRTYLDRSTKKFSELVQYHMVLANKYRSQNQYAACKSAYRNVMVMLKNTGDKVYREAKSGYDACDALEGDRY